MTHLQVAAQRRVGGKEHETVSREDCAATEQQRSRLTCSGRLTRGRMGVGEGMRKIPPKRRAWLYVSARERGRGGRGISGEQWVVRVREEKCPIPRFHETQEGVEELSNELEVYTFTM